MCVFVCVFTRVFTYVFMYVCVYICVYVCVCVCVHMHVCMNARVLHRLLCGLDVQWSSPWLPPVHYSHVTGVLTWVFRHVTAVWCTIHTYGHTSRSHIYPHVHVVDTHTARCNSY